MPSVPSGWGGQSVAWVEEELVKCGFNICMDKIRIQYVPTTSSCWKSNPRLKLSFLKGGTYLKPEQGQVSYGLPIHFLMAFCGGLAPMRFLNRMSVFGNAQTANLIELIGAVLGHDFPDAR